MLRLSNIKLGINELENPEVEMQQLQKMILKKLGLDQKDLIRFDIFKKSIDARKKEQIFFAYTLDIYVKNEKPILLKNKTKDLLAIPEQEGEKLRTSSHPLTDRPVIVGTGPAGLFAGLVLAKYGYRPVLLERGDDVDTRIDRIYRFWKDGVLDTECNVQFGEGGAGTFSDGKLTTLTHDKRRHLVFDALIEAGAPDEIRYTSKPHIGTDKLRHVVKSMRQKIIALGGEVRFKAKVTDFLIKNSEIAAVVINDEETLPCSAVLLAIGHSARDTFEVLYKRGVFMQQKPFSIGVRIEHPQELIDRAQYGKYAGHAALGAADYKLAYHSKSGRSAYTFCMCPGGYVVAAASEVHAVVTNGMSLYKRDGKNANAALLVGITPADFQSDHPLAGIAFQRQWEKQAYLAGKESYKAPAQLVEDFLKDTVSTRWGSVLPTYEPGVAFAPLIQCLPPYVIETMKEALVYFDTKIKGFAMPDSILTGVETRSSSPVRITRDEQSESNIGGLYPMGEGAGYAGGIMSSAVDGMKTAEKLMERYKPFS